MKDLLFLSNGHGEDVIGGRVLDAIRAARPELSVEAWPMVGEGAAYVARGVPTIGARNLLPSAGFATLDRDLMIADLKAGWIGTYWRQFRDALRLSGRYRMALAIGDIVPLAAAALTRSPYMFIGCAKSAYYGRGYGYNWIEKRLMRGRCINTFPRDRLTALELDADGIRNAYLGNPMMDGLEGSGDRLGVPADAIVVGMLAGTRSDAEINLLDLLAAAARLRHHHAEPARFRFVFAARSELDPRELATVMQGDGRHADWDFLTVENAAEGIVVRLRNSVGTEALVVKGRFSDVLRMSDVVVGMAGTANEQAIGLGIPLVTVPAAGIQGERYVRMKALYFGESAVNVPRDPDEIAKAVVGILGDPARRGRMAAGGRERMGEPGASRAIADEVLSALDRLQGAKR